MLIFARDQLPKHRNAGAEKITALHRSLAQRWRGQRKAVRVALPKPVLNQGLRLVDRIARDFGLDRVTREDVWRHSGSFASARGQGIEQNDFGDVHFANTADRQAWLQELRKHRLMKPTAGALFLDAVFDVTGEPYLTIGIIEAHGLKSRYWRRRVIPRIETAAWGDGEGDGILAHVMHDLRSKGWQEGHPIPYGIRETIFCENAQRLNVEASSFAAAVKRCRNVFEAAERRDFKAESHPAHTAVIGTIQIKVAAERLVRDPETMAVMEPDRPHIVPNSTHWRRAIDRGDVVLVV
jgi:hypothetical protein